MARPKRTEANANNTSESEASAAQANPSANPATSAEGSEGDSSTNTADGVASSADSTVNESELGSIPRNEGATEQPPSIGGTATNEPDESSDESAPYGRDANGNALAPYGVKKDGTPKRKRGAKSRGERKPDDGTSAAIDEGTPEGAALALVAEPDAGGFFSRSADAKRCQRARENAPYWRDLAAMALEFGEAPMLAVVKSQLSKDPRIGREKAERIAAIIPRMRDVPVSGMKNATVLSANADALSFIFAYLFPARPDHPLLRATVQLALSQYAYLRAINEAVAKAALAQ